MKLQGDDWDDEERRALAGIERELDELRARHAGDPPFELLRAAHADVLPDSLQASLTEHLKRSAWSRSLIDGDAEQPLDADGERRLLAQIDRTPRPSRRPVRTWLPALAAAAALLIMVGILRNGGAGRWFGRSSPSAGERPVVSAPPAPAFVLALAKPEVKLTSQALLLRSDAREGRFVDEIAPALKAYNGSDYVEADRQFASLELRYPRSVEVPFYRAIALLFQNDAARAMQSLQAARRLDDGAFAPEIAWYLAVAAERAGDATRARAELDALCGRTSAFTARACEAAVRFGPK